MVRKLYILFIIVFGFTSNGSVIKRMQKSEYEKIVIYVAGIELSSSLEGFERVIVDEIAKSISGYKQVEIRKKSPYEERWPLRVEKEIDQILRLYLKIEIKEDNKKYNYRYRLIDLYSQNEVSKNGKFHKTSSKNKSSLLNSLKFRIVNYIYGKRYLKNQIKNGKITRGKYTGSFWKKDAYSKKGEAILYVSSIPTNAFIWVDGKKYRFRTVHPDGLQTPIRLETGRKYHIRLSSRGHKNTLDEIIRLKKGERRKLLFHLTTKKASIRLISTPKNIEYLLNGKLRGKTDGLVRVSSGIHKIEFRKDKKILKTFNLDLLPGQRKKIIIDFTGKRKIKRKRLIEKADVTYATFGSIGYRVDGVHPPILRGDGPPGSLELEFGIRNKKNGLLFGFGFNYKSLQNGPAEVNTYKRDVRYLLVNWMIQNAVSKRYGVVPGIGLGASITEFNMYQEGIAPIRNSYLSWVGGYLTLWDLIRLNIRYEFTISTMPEPYGTGSGDQKISYGFSLGWNL